MFIFYVKLHSVKGCTSRWHGWCRQLLWYGAENLGSIVTYINSKVHVFRYFSFGSLIRVFRNLHRIRRHVFLIAYCPGGLLTSNNKRRVDLINDRLSERWFHLRNVGTLFGSIVKMFFSIYVNEIDGRRFVTLAVWDAHSWWCNWSEIRCHWFDVRVTIVGSVFCHFGFFLLAFVRRDGNVLNKLVIFRMFARRTWRVWFPRRTVRFKCCWIAEYLILRF